jgi:hypothetical protein
LSSKIYLANHNLKWLLLKLLPCQLCQEFVLKIYSANHSLKWLLLKLNPVNFTKNLSSKINLANHSLKMVVAEAFTLSTSPKICPQKSIQPTIA